MPYTVTPTPTHIPDLLILQPRVLGDARGFFFESFNQQDFNQATGLNVPFLQDNHSRSASSNEAFNLIKSMAYDFIQVKIKKITLSMQSIQSPRIFKESACTE